MKYAKQYVLTILGLLLAGVGLYLVKTLTDPQGILKPLPYLLIGIGCGLFGHGLGDLISKKTMASNPELAKQAEIDAKDERNIMLNSHAKAKAYDMMCYIFAALLLAYALMGVSFSVILSFVTMCFVKHGDNRPDAPQSKLEAFNAMED